MKYYRFVLLSCSVFLLVSFCPFFSDVTAGHEFEELSEDEVAFVGMKTRQIRRDAISQSLVAKQQGCTEWYRIYSLVEIILVYCFLYVVSVLFSISIPLFFINQQ